jgi:hypothetical protein
MAPDKPLIRFDVFGRVLAVGRYGRAIPFRPFSRGCPTGHGRRSTAAVAVKGRMNVRIGLAALLLATCQSTIAHAHDPATYVRAGQEFEALFAQAATDGRPPRLADPHVANLIGVLSDSKRYLDDTTYEVKDIALLGEVCGKSNAAVMSYALFDHAKAIDRSAEATVKTQQVFQLMERNFLRFQDELVHLQPFLVRCLGKSVPLLDDFIATLPPAELTEVRRSGVRGTRQGAFNAFYGFLQAVNHPALKASYKDAMLSAMADTAAQYASILQPAMRRQVADIAASMRTAVDGRLRGHIEQILRAMKDTRCEGLCRF